MKKKKQDLFDDIMSHGIATGGAVGITGVVGRLPHSPQSNAIQGSMGMMRVPLTVNAASITLRSFDSLVDVEKKIKKRR